MINLTKIEAYGFKSFADKFELRFSQPITAIVGPNGCGKSNVSDAIRWVLGEQSAKILRGKTMQDLIFAGTEKRKSMSYCEVSLFFDNKNRIFPLDFDEIVISRKLYRSGESEYLINRNVSKLKIISDLLRDVGLGREGYSIVGQGRMDAILNAKPDDRRAIFEEALGISKFRVRKVETERKLDRYRDNMTRLNDIMVELDRQLGPLKQQSENAKKYLDISEKLKVLEVNAYIHSYDNAYVEKQRIGTLINALEEEKSLADKKLEEANRYYQEIFERMANTDNEISALHNEEMELSVAVERQSGEIKVLGEQLKFFNKAVEDTLSQIEFDQNAIEQTTIKLQDLNNDLKQKTENHKKLSEQLVELNCTHANLENQIAKMRDSNELAQNEKLNLLDSLTEKKATLARLTTEKISCAERLQDIDEQEEEIMQKLAHNTEEEKQVVLVFEEAKHNAEKLRMDLEDYQKQNVQNEEQLFSTNASFNTLSQNTAVLIARQKYLQSSLENYEGFAGSVKQLMKDVATDTTLSDKVMGVVANVIKVDKKYEIAIESILGNSLQNIITKNEEDAKYLIAHLKARRYGRITFMPLTSIKSRTIDENSVLSEVGCLGVTSDFVSTKTEFLPVVNSLLGNSLLVDTIENAIKISKKYFYRFRIVTLDGEIILPAGTISGGSKKSEGGLLGTEREIEEIKQKIEKAKQDQADCAKKRDELNAKKQHLALVIARTNADYQQNIVKIAAYQERISKFGALSASEQNFIKGISAERNTINEKLESINKSISNVEAEIVALQNKKETLANTSDEDLKEYNAIKNKRNEVFDAINDLKLKISLLASNISATNKEIATSNDFILATDFDLKEKQQQLEVYNLNVKELKLKLFEGNSDNEKVNALANIHKKVEEINLLKDKLKDECASADIARTNAGLELNKVNEKILRAENDLSNIDLNLDALQKRMDEIYELTYSEALQYKVEDFNYPEAEKEIVKYKNSLSRLGDVNLTSIEGYSETKTRYDEMQAQIDDLKKAEEDQQKIIKDLTDEMVTRFNAGFSEINKNFGEIFRELFAGGHARLTIEAEEGKSPLDYGIEIEAQPPGKKLQSINLLSGGERSFTAIAILFAIIKMCPMPFCVLDEVEAALDDANIDRFAKYLRKFSEKTQFLVITHKKATMESADVLYGITMEEKGVSKNVSVQLSEAIAIGQQ